MLDRISVLLSLARRLWSDQQGVAAVLGAFGLVVLLGFAGGAIDVASWLNAVRSLQATADQAAFSGAAAAGSAGCGSASWAQQARSIAAAHGYVDGQNSVVDPSCEANKFTVRIAAEQPLWFTQLFLSQAPTASAQATAQMAAAVSDVCVLALDGTSVAEGVVGNSASAFWLNGNARVNLGCTVAVDSSNVSALSAGGTSDLVAKTVYLVGDRQGSPSGSATLATSPTPNNIRTYQTPIEDPYLGRTIPALSSCTYTQLTVSSDTPLSPGVYCGGLTLGGPGGQKATIALNSGIYYVVGGSLTINAGATLTGTDVTFVLTGNRLGQNGYATITINGGANISLAAPTVGAMGGLLFFQDRNAPAGGSSSSSSSCGNGTSQNQIAGGSDQKLTGAVYFPNQSLCYGGSSNIAGAGKCTQIIARTISFTGTSDVQLSCDGTGVAPITVQVPRLIK